MEREVGGGIGMGNTCKSMADSFQCMTKPTTIKNKKERKSGKMNEKRPISREIQMKILNVMNKERIP